jgi:tetratricopeptide (TPR) repeat protein
MSREKRIFKRYQRITEFEVALGDKTYHARTLDYSLEGLSIEIEGFPSVNKGDVISLDLAMLNMKTSARVVRASRTDTVTKLGLLRLGLMHGYIGDFRLADILLGLQRSGRTGVLFTRMGKINKSVYFDQGDMVFATSNLTEDRLGDMLMRERRITPEQYNVSSKVVIDTGKRHGAVLVEMGYLKPKELFGAVKRSVEAIILGVLGFAEGEFVFKEGPLPSKETITLKLSAANLIYRGVKCIEDIQLVKTLSPGADEVLCFASDPLNLYQDIVMDEDDKKLLSLVDCNRTYRMVIQDSGVETFAAMRSLNALLATRIIETMDEMYVPTEERKSKRKEDANKAEERARAEQSKAEELFRRNEKATVEELIVKVERMFRDHRKLGYYGVLGLARDAHTSEIKKAYYRMAREFHPDRHFALPETLKGKLNTVFSFITSAYSTLSNPAQRAGYDKGPQTHEEAMAADPLEMAREKFKEARILEDRGRNEEAARLYAEAAYLNTEEPDYHYRAAMAQHRAGRPKEAERTLQRAIKLAPNNPDYAAGEGYIFTSLGFPKRARSCFERALKIKPMHARALEGLKALSREA